LLCYSAEFIYSFEKAKKAKNTTNFWFGGGCVGSFFALSHPFLGAECAIEIRLYINPDEFRKFFISGYLGTAFVSNFKDVSSIGIIPGLKINYKIQKSPKAIIEPYLSLSLPISYNLKASVKNYTIPVLTLGVRFGGCKLKKDIKPQT
jgi:hypothetical protein